MSDVFQKMASFFEIPAFKDTALLASHLKENPLVIVDVGATGGIAKRWREIAGFCHFLTFDPDPRADLPQTANTTNFSTGLWSSQTSLSLQLTQNLVGSSVFPFNDQALSSFINHKAHKALKSVVIPVSTMERVLSEKKLPPHFLKIDTEGADLEILKGAETFLDTSCLGVRVEVSFVERHQGAPFFAEIDTYLRSHGYTLMEIHRERWPRKNRLISSNTNTQMIWGDAVYMLSIDVFLTRCENLSPQEKTLAYLRFFTLLMVHRMHDTAKELQEVAEKHQLIEKSLLKQSELLLRKSIPTKTRHFLLSFAAVITSFGGYLFLFPFPRARNRCKLFLVEKTKEWLHSIAVSLQITAGDLIRDLEFRDLD